MNNNLIDWNNAPEEATHCCQTTSVWYKIAKGGEVYKDLGDGEGWQESIMTVAEIDRLDCFIPRPTSVENIVSASVEATNSTEIKPPIGLCPKNIFIENMNKQRKDDIEQSIVRYIEAGKGVPNDWLQELIELNTLLADSDEVKQLDIDSVDTYCFHATDSDGWIEWGRDGEKPDIPGDTWLEKEYSDGGTQKGENRQYSWHGGGVCGTPRWYVTRYRYIDEPQE